MDNAQLTEIKYICRKCLEASNKVVPLYPNRLKPVRLAIGISASKFARQIGISATHYYNLENGKFNLESLGYHKLQKIAAALNVEVDDLFIKPKAA